MNIFSWKITSFDLLSVWKKKLCMLSYESRFSRHMRNMGNAAEYFMFFRWKSKILVCLCIFYKNFWVKNKGTIFFTNHFYLGWKENSRKRLTEIPWAVELSGKTSMISTKPRPPQNYYLFWIDHHFVGMSLFKRRTEVFSFYIIGEMFSTNFFFVDSVAN